MGMARPIVTQKLYAELGFDRGEPLDVVVAGRRLFAPAQEIVNGDGGFGVPDFNHTFAPFAVEMMLPAWMIQDYALAINYSTRKIFLADHYSFDRRDIAVPMRVNPDSGLAAVTAIIDGQAQNLLLDAGSGYSWINGAVAAKWFARHPDWLRARGAVGQSNANMVNFDFEIKGLFARMDAMDLGAVRLSDVGFLATAPLLGAFGGALLGDPFWAGFNKHAPEPVIGWLGANALSPFVATFDYKNQMSYWRRIAQSDVHENDQPGLTIIRKGNRYFIAALVAPSGAEPPKSIVIGDEILAVDFEPANAFSRGRLLARLKGRAGTCEGLK